MFFQNKKLKITRHTVFIAVFVLVIVSVAYAAASYQVNSGVTVTIDEHTVCKKVTNNNALAIFVPTNTADEWTAFRTNASGVTLATCNPCEGLANTNWGAGPSGCSNSNQRCYNGACITCGGWINAGYCWYNSAADTGCTTTCETHGGVYNGTCDWVNDPTTNSTCLHWYSYGGGNRSSSMGPLWHLGDCYYHIDGNNDCDGIWPTCIRQCACNE